MMKLFVWSNPYPISYGSSMVFAIAESEDEARRVIEEKAKAYSYGEYEDTNPEGVKLGAPTRVVDVPCAEWHRWEE